MRASNSLFAVYSSQSPESLKIQLNRQWWHLAYDGLVQFVKNTEAHEMALH